MRLAIVGLLLASSSAIADPKPAKPPAKRVSQPCSIFRTPTFPAITDLEALKLARMNERPPIVDDQDCWFGDADLAGYYRLDLVENLIAQPVVRARPVKKPPPRR